MKRRKKSRVPKARGKKVRPRKPTPKPPKRAATKAKQSPVADPKPRVIDLFRRMLNRSLNDEGRARLRREITEILAAWKAREDLDELRELLGVKGKSSHRAQRSVNREFGMAIACDLEGRATKDVARDFHVEPRTVERARQTWRPVVAPIATAVAQLLLRDIEP